jgi:pimeloyl-ACP methyl ester carboxylesterase
MLLVSGGYDEATPPIVEEIHNRVAGSRWELFEESSHMPHVEKPERVGDSAKMISDGCTDAYCKVLVQRRESILWLLMAHS